MHPLDFLSQSPKIFIFQKEANKTNLGGVLFLLYLIICLGIFLYYLLNYTKNNKFEVQYTYNQNNSFINYTEKKNDILFNPEIDIIAKLLDKDGNFLSDNFIIIYYSRNTEGHWDGRSRGVNFTERASDIDIEVYYRCFNKYNWEEDKRESYLLEFWYTHFFLDHQNKTLPIYRNGLTYNILNLEFAFNTKIKKNFEWQVINYIDKGGLFSSRKEYYGGSMKSKDIFIYDSIEKLKIKNYDGTITYYDFLYKLKVDSDYDFYDEYIRTEVSWLNIFSNSFSLMMSLYNGFTVVFDFLYARNFNNYKIVQNILSKSDKKESNVNIFSLMPINDKNKIDIKENLIENHIENNLYYENNDNIEGRKDYSFKLPKLHLCDFIGNTFCLSQKCINKKQNIISASNELLAKYFSIERILYNQIKFEHLMKDYKWNNPYLRDIKINGQIIKLKDYIINT